MPPRPSKPAPTLNHSLLEGESQKPSARRRRLRWGRQPFGFTRWRERPCYRTWANPRAEIKVDPRAALSAAAGTAGSRAGLHRPASRDRRRGDDRPADERHQRDPLPSTGHADRRGPWCIRQDAESHADTRNHGRKGIDPLITQIFKKQGRTILQCDLTRAQAGHEKQSSGKSRLKLKPENCYHYFLK